MILDGFDQGAWLARIGYTGSREPTLSTLRAVVQHHASTIAYESIDVLLRRLPKLDVASLQQKMLHGQRGGYCFEQNMLFRAGLRSLGFAVTSLQARVVRGLAVDAPRPALHWSCGWTFKKANFSLTLGLATSRQQQHWPFVR